MTGKGIMVVTVLALVAASPAAEAQLAEPGRTIGIIAHGPARSFEDGLRELPCGTGESKS